MAIMEIALPFGSKVEVCNICGQYGGNITKCRYVNEGDLEKNRFQLGDIVHIQWLNERILSDDYRVTRFFYASNHEYFPCGGCAIKERYPLHHQLCVELSQSFDSKTGQWVPYNPEHHSQSWMDITQAELLIRTGAEEQVRQLDQPTQTNTGSGIFKRFFRWLGL